MNSRSPQSLIIILLTIGILCLLGGAVLLGGNLGGILEGIRDGREVSCNVVVNAPFLGSNLQISQPPSCQPLGGCIVSPFKSLSFAGITGDLGLWQSGILYATQEVDLSRLETRKTYTITACIPQEASAVRIGIITETGGVVNDQAVTIQ